MRQTDEAPHPKAIEREKERERQERAEDKAKLWAYAASTVLGLVSLYPIIRGTRTDNHIMMLIGFVIALVSLRIMPLDKLVELVDAWRK